MSWLRWWQGTVNDPKWRIVAMRAKCRAGDCVAVWAFLLEVAKEGDGDISSADAEECAVVLGYDLETVTAVIAAMRDKALIEGDRIAAWEKRQPKREDDSRARVAAFRARKAEEKSVTDQQNDARNDDVTHGNAPETETETEKTSSLRSDDQRASAPKAREGEAMLLTSGMTAETLADWKRVRTAKRAGPITVRVAEGFIRECRKADISLEAAGRKCCEKGWQGFEADWLNRPQQRAGPAQPPRRGSAAIADALTRITNDATDNHTVPFGVAGFLPGR